MKMNEKTKVARLTSTYFLMGFILGLFLVAAAYAIQFMTASGEVFEGSLWDMVKSFHRVNPVLFLMDNIPLILAIAGAIIGRKQREKMEYLIELQELLRERDRQLRSIRFRYAKILEKTDECLFITTREGEVLDINKAGIDLLRIEALFGTIPSSKEELLTLLNERPNIAETVYADRKDRSLLFSKLQEDKVVSNYPLRLKRFDGEVFDALVTVSVEMSNEGRSLIFGRIIDLSIVKRAEVLLKKTNAELEKKNRELMDAFTKLQVLKIQRERESQELSRKNAELKRLNRLLAEMAITDGLTGLYNHRHFMGYLKREWERSRRSGRSFCVLMVDIDYFKAFNDKWGHQVGDRALVTIAKTIKSQTREYDIVSRYGGEEFALILPETDLNTCYTVAQRIRKAVEQRTILIKNREAKDCLTVSVGVTFFLPKEEDTRTFEQVLQDADVALYLAKNRGRNRVELYRRDILSETAKVIPIPGINSEE